MAKVEFSKNWFSIKKKKREKESDQNSKKTRVRRIALCDEISICSVVKLSFPLSFNHLLPLISKDENHNTFNISLWIEGFKPGLIAFLALNFGAFLLRFGFLVPPLALKFSQFYSFARVSQWVPRCYLPTGVGLVFSVVDSAARGFSLWGSLLLRLNMTNGGGEGGSQRRELIGKTSPFRGNDFAYALARMAVAQTCESAEINTYQDSQVREGVRFSSFHESALETLTDVMIDYIQNIGKTAQLYANVAGRVEGNALDIVQALEDLGSGLGFDGAPDIDHCIADSGVVKDIIRFTGEAEEIPFVYALPRFPFNRGKRPAPSFFEIGAEPPDEHIPVWLPAFPETKTSIKLKETSGDKIEGDVQSRENGLSLTSRQQYVDVDRLKVQKYQKDVQKTTEEPKGNPFLAAPLWVGEKNVPPVFCPSELTNEEVSSNHIPEKQLGNSHHIPALEAYAPVCKINDKNRLAETEDGEKKGGARTQRALLRFKIGTRKTSVCLTINQSLEKMGWFQEDGDKRENKVEREEKRESIDTDVK